MRFILSILFTGIVIISLPAMAGNVVVNNGQLSWQSTQCTEPSAPSSITSSSNREAPAEKVNRHVTAYNDYVQKSQAYMDCVSQEAQTDSKIASDAITNAAQQKIDESRKSVADLGAPLQKK